ncbi:MAG: hypothetical protein K8R85_00995 [Bacteroidetes bacterium]|nr:hypothetical protein [Bacteroidota bacterium]
MKEKLLEINSLIDLLGWKDDRTIEDWCTENKVPVIKIGKKKYTVIDFVERFVALEIEKYVVANYDNPDKIMNALKEDNKSVLAELLDAPVTEKVKNKYIERNSKVTEDFLKELKAA